MSLALPLLALSSLSSPLLASLSLLSLPLPSLLSLSLIAAAAAAAAVATVAAFAAAAAPAAAAAATAATRRATGAASARHLGRRRSRRLIEVPARRVPRHRAVATVLASAALGGCAMSTAPGALGVWRPQLLTADAGIVTARAAEQYASLSGRARRAGRLDNDALLSARVRRVAGRLIREVGAFRPDAARWHWQVNVFDADELNAFCVPGGRIGVYSGLVRRLDLNDAELAAVLGHEIAHALREHAREQDSQHALMTAVAQGVGVFGGRTAALQSVAVEAGSHLFVALPFSRTMESEADRIGLELMARAGYDPRLASGVWEKLMALPASGRTAGWLSTHPGDASRIADLDAAAPKVMALYEAKADAIARSPATVADAAPLLAAPLPAVQTLPAVPDRVGIGQDSRQVERMASAAACHPQPVAALAGKGPGFETYVVACSNGEAMSFRCEFGHCRPAR